MKTAPQIVYSGLGNKNLTPTQEGGCRICGGLLLGETGEYQKLVSDSWTDEGYNKDLNSGLVCEACVGLQKYYNRGLGFGVLATEEYFKKFDTTADVVDALKCLPDIPFVLLLKTGGGMFRKHLFYAAPVNYNNKEVSAMLVFRPWNDIGLGVCTVNIIPDKVLEYITQLREEGLKTLINPFGVDMCPEKHIASHIVFWMRKEEGKAKKKVSSK